VEVVGNDPTLLSTIPSWLYSISPDLSQISYVLFASAYNELSVMAASGGASTKVSPGLPVMAMEWLPNGQQIVMLLSATAAIGQLHVVNPDGSESTKVSGELPIQGFDVSETGGRIAMIVREPTGSAAPSMLYVVDNSGANLEMLAEFPSTYVGATPVWSPNGTKIAYVANGIYVVDANGGTPTLVAGGPGEFFDTPLWSPDSESLAFLGPGGVTTVNADGSDLSLISGTLRDFTSSLSMSPDGSKLAYVVLTICAPCVQSAQAGTEVREASTATLPAMPAAHYYTVYMVNFDGSGLRSIGGENSATQWSPDSHYYLLQGNDGAVIVSMDGKNSFRLEGLPASPSAWSPDGRRFAYGYGDLYVQNLYATR
jgi:Tol biopolymer transport system component